jgi:mannan endo-1,4-beta-mannosidase
LRINRSLLTAIGIPVVVLATVVIFLLTANPGSHPLSSAGAGTGGGAGSPAPGKSKDPRGKSHKRAPALPQNFVGIAVSRDIAGSVRSFTRTTGVHPALVELYSEFGAGFPQLQAHRVIGSNSIPLIQWNPRHAPLGQIASGAYDRYVRHFAAAVKAFGHHIVLSFAHEMNGTWYPWGRPDATPAQFKAAWRRIHTIFARRHVTNVTWSWDPSHGGSPASQWWPGSRYVDWIGIDGYLRPGQTFRYIFHRQLSIIRRVTRRPVFIAETAVAPSAGQARQVAALFGGVASNHLMGFVWFDVNRLKAWRLEGRPAADRAFRKLAARMR